MTCEDGSIYEGEIVNNKPEGRGRLIKVNAGSSIDIIEGQWSNGLKHGKVTWADLSGYFFTGEYKYDRKHG